MAEARSCADFSFCSNVFGRELLGSVRARGGFAFHRILVYGNAGYAFSNLNDYSLSTPDTSPSVFHQGSTIGGGVEFALRDHVRTGIEYRSTYFDRAGSDSSFGLWNRAQSNEISLRITFH